MAVYGGQRSNQLFIGLSSDKKPTIADFSAQFYEYDTGKTYIWIGTQRLAPDSGQWVEYFNMTQIPVDSSSAQI